MAMVPNGVGTLLKISNARVGERYRQTDGRATTYSARVNLLLRHSVLYTKFFHRTMLIGLLIV